MMMKITDNAAFRQGYDWLTFVQKHAGEFGKSIQELEVELKRELRKWSHRSNAMDVGLGFMVERRIVRDNGIDGYVEIISIPDVFNTEESAEEFFKDFIEMHCSPSAYDCTGQPFTGWYKLFKRHGHFHAYHCVSFDV